MEYSFDETGDTLRIAIEGRFAAASVDEFRELALPRIDRFPKVLFDFSSVSYIDSSALGVLMQFHQRVRANGGVMKIVALQEQPKMVFDITKVGTVFDVRDTVEDALMSF